jgi:hypothetical protein
MITSSTVDTGSAVFLLKITDEDRGICAFRDCSALLGRIEMSYLSSAEGSSADIARERLERPLINNARSD